MKRRQLGANGPAAGRLAAFGTSGPHGQGWRAYRGRKGNDGGGPVRSWRATSAFRRFSRGAVGRSVLPL